MPYGPSSSCCTLTDLCCKQLLSAQAFIGRRISDRWDKAHMAPCAGLSSSLSSRVPIDPAVVANYWLVCQVLADLRQAVAATCGEANNKAQNAKDTACAISVARTEWTTLRTLQGVLGTVQLQADHSFVVVDNQAYIVLK